MRLAFSRNVSIMNKNPDEILNELKNKFDLNYAKWLKLDHQDVYKTFLCARSISEIGQILKERSTSKHQKRCCEIFDEVFSDVVSATYLATCALDKPANIVLRRVIELGVASIYLWDMPHVTYSWEFNDQDLNFNEMIDHINADGYKRYVSNEVDEIIEGDLIDSNPLKKYYGELSDIVHGKITSFESNLPNRFTFSKTDWDSFISKINKILKILVDAYLKRFGIKDELSKRIPPFMDKE